MDPSTFDHPHQLSYTIHSSSTCSPVYHPFNILEDAPTDPNSRWSGSGPATKSTSAEATSLIKLPSKRKDYIIIDLGKPSIVRSITFGKFHRPHPCNLKLFRIWGSLAPGEGKGDFRALLGNQTIDQHLNPASCTNPLNSHHHHHLHHHQHHQANHHQSIFKNQPLAPLPSSSSSSSTTTTTNQTAAAATATTTNNNLEQSHSINPIQIDPHDLIKPINQSPPHPIRARGPTHRTGPRMELLAQGELKNDTNPETVPLRWKNDRVTWFKSSEVHRASSDSTQTVIVPVRYIKIEPLSATGSNYNCSIWHISVKGHDEDHIMSPCLEIYEKWRASAALRLCLKHLRQTGHLEAFQALINSATNPDQSPLLVQPSTIPVVESESQTVNPTHGNLAGSSSFEESQSSNPAQFHFEHSLVSALHSALVPHLEPRFGLDGPLPSTSQSSDDLPFKIPPISDAEQIVINAALDNLFDPWALAEAPTVTCHQILPRSTPASGLPCPRGGHQMCIDSKRRKIWLFGGFDGVTDLGDLWVYHLEPTHISTQEESSPPSGMPNDDLRFKETIDPPRPTVHSHGNTQWQLISRDVKLDNGPMNRSCHKMVLDEMTGDLYVLGRYTERGRPPTHQPSDFPQSTTNGQSPIHSRRQNILPNRVLNTLHSSTNGSGTVEQADTTADHNDPTFTEIIRRQAATNLPASFTTGPTPQPQLDVDELMGDAETVTGPLHAPSSATGQFKNDMFRFRPFQDPSSHELWDNNGRIGQWECLSQDTHLENGPQLIFDHQMVLDSDRRKIYVFGGKIIQPADSLSQETASSSSRVTLNQYSGLFEYDLTTRTWVQLMTDPESSTTMTEIDLLDHQVHIPSRMGHSLILDKKRQCLWVLTGERDHHYYSDLWKYDITHRRAELIVADYTYGGKNQQTSDVFANSSGSAPEAGFSQRTTFDPEADEWHMFCGLCRDRGSGEAATKPNSKSEMMSSEFWRWRIDEGRWTKVTMKAQVDGTETPPPRFAHQMVFDDLTKTHYVFGGNPADNDNEPTRLGDFWKLQLIQPTRREALRRCLFALRRQHFIEMCEKETDTVSALLYLQNDLSSVTNHLDEREAKLFRACTSHLLAGPGPRVPLLEEDAAQEDDLEGRYGEEDGEDCGMTARQKSSEDQDHADVGPGAQNGNGLGTEIIDRYRKIRDQRTQLFQSLLKFFPPSMTEPEESLMDLIDVWGDRESFW
ncbi:hypothetical protein PGTUg99_001630 [Puccinia graminis f. sp. tritici]|uniref:Muskelin N-terminal domain-containing protein n=2 Tax=Puccinia graminis f. sp. tritici TaxID=56615 RepID=A0A5B0LG50_PUCGR|nr:hypothetical protein PGTUg99_001630 [Puccinia graminis f. sp. tritici]